MSPERKEYQCARCGSSIMFETCQNCGGEGYTSHDCGEDSCCCADPEDNVPCDVCKGDGTLAHCLSSPEWCQTHPMPGRETTDRHTVESFSLKLVTVESFSLKLVDVVQQFPEAR